MKSEKMTLQYELPGGWWQMLLEEVESKTEGEEAE